MLKAGTLSPDASIASTGKSLRYIGKNRCYAYSGVLASAAAPATFLKFDSGTGLIVADLQVFNHAINGAGNNLQYQVFLNGEMILAQTNFDQNNPYNRLRFIIPPFTDVEVKVDNLSGSSDNCSVTLTGRVYE